MATPFDAAIAAMEEEVRVLQAGISMLRRRQELWTSGTKRAEQPSSDPDLFSDADADVTNEAAVLKILGEAHPKYCRIGDIVDRGPSVGGRTLNVNSVRWVLKHAIDGGTVEKRKEKGRALYRLKR